MIEAIKGFFRRLIGNHTPEELKEKGRKYVRGQVNLTRDLYGTDDAVNLIILSLAKETRKKEFSLLDRDRYVAAGMREEIEEYLERKGH